MAVTSVYLDNNATTPLHPEVKKAITDTLDTFGNASSLHGYGRAAKRLLEDARENIAGFIGAASEEIMFAGSGSEANNTVLNIFSMSCSKCEMCENGRPEIVTTQIEHPCILETSKCLNERGIPVQYVRVDSTGRIVMDELSRVITDKTGLVSVMMANNEIGTLQDIKAIAALAHERGALMHTDAVQALGKVPVDVKNLDVDFLSLSGHKIYGPKGIGVLYVKKKTPFCPFIRGGHQEQGRRAGTENLLGVVGFSKAVDMLREEMDSGIPRLLKLKKRLKAGIEEHIPDITINGHLEKCIPNTLNISFEGAEGEAILLYLDLEGIAVSTGSACSSGSLDPSHVLLATGLEAEVAHGSIRFSLGRENTAEEIDYVIEKLRMVIEKIRGMSTSYSRKA